jgi:hypothetical protein
MRTTLTHPRALPPTPPTPRSLRLSPAILLGATGLAAAAFAINTPRAQADFVFSGFAASSSWHDDDTDISFRFGYSSASHYDRGWAHNAWRPWCDPFDRPWYRPIYYRPVVYYPAPVIIAPAPRYAWVWDGFCYRWRLVGDCAPTPVFVGSAYCDDVVVVSPTPVYNDPWFYSPRTIVTYTSFNRPSRWYRDDCHAISRVSTTIVYSTNDWWDDHDDWGNRFSVSITVGNSSPFRHGSPCYTPFRHPRSPRYVPLIINEPTVVINNPTIIINNPPAPVAVAAQTDRIDRTDRTDRSGRTQRTERADATDRSDRSDREISSPRVDTRGSESLPTTKGTSAIAQTLPAAGALPIANPSRTARSEQGSTRTSEFPLAIANPAPSDASAPAAAPTPNPLGTVREPAIARQTDTKDAADVKGDRTARTIADTTPASTRTTTTSPSTQIAPATPAVAIAPVIAPAPTPTRETRAVAIAPETEPAAPVDTKDSKGDRTSRATPPTAELTQPSPATSIQTRAPKVDTGDSQDLKPQAEPGTITRNTLRRAGNDVAPAFDAPSTRPSKTEPSETKLDAEPLAPATPVATPSRDAKPIKMVDSRELGRRGVPAADPTADQPAPSRMSSPSPTPSASPSATPAPDAKPLTPEPSRPSTAPQDVPLRALKPTPSQSPSPMPSPTATRRDLPATSPAPSIKPGAVAPQSPEIKPNERRVIAPASPEVKPREPRVITPASPSESPEMKPRQPRVVAPVAPANPPKAEPAPRPAAPIVVPRNARPMEPISPSPAPSASPSRTIAPAPAAPKGITPNPSRSPRVVSPIAPATRQPDSIAPPKSPSPFVAPGGDSEDRKPQRVDRPFREVKPRPSPSPSPAPAINPARAPRLPEAARQPRPAPQAPQARPAAPVPSPKQAAPSPAAPSRAPAAAPAPAQSKQPPAPRPSKSEEE